VLVSGIAVSGLAAQVVKAPRYQGGFDAPTPQLTLPAPPPAITPHGVVVEDVVARVNDQIISRSDVQRVEDQLALEVQQNRMSPADVATAQKDLLRDMIDEQLLLSKAKELGINADADVIRQLDEIRKKNKLDSLDALEHEAQAQGVNWEDFKAQIRNGILKQKVVGEEVGRRLQMTEAEETAFYKEHLSEFQQPEQVKLSEILVPLPETATPAEINQGEAKANEIKTKIMQGADFADMAKKYSGGPSAAQGGDLGLWKRGGLAKVLEDQVFPLKVGETTQPIRTRQGWLIMKVTEHKMAGPMPIKDVEPQIQEALYMKAMQPALRAYLTKLRENSYVNIAPGFVDSGASVDETTPAFTAYQPPAIKKKKTAATARYQTISAKPAVSSPDTNGGRTITGPDAKPAIDPVTGMAVMTPVKVSATKSSKPGKKIRKEKIRFGRAPRTALQGGGAEDVAAGTTVAPGAVMSTEGATVGSSAAVATNASVDLADNPLTPQAPEQKKTRYAAKAAEVKAKKAASVSFKKEQKVVATAAPASDEEKTSTAVQAAPLGLNGDTEKAAKQAKKDKKKKVKGAPKERLADQPAQKKEAPAAPAPTANPNLSPTNLPPASTPPQQ
jgi:peptidyl-prolyl cis-trans isomerase SurA